jgi:hypothetical protein
VLEHTPLERQLGSGRRGDQARFAVRPRQDAKPLAVGRRKLASDRRATNGADAERSSRANGEAYKVAEIARHSVADAQPHARLGPHVVLRVAGAAHARACSVLPEDWGELTKAMAATFSGLSPHAVDTRGAATLHGNAHSKLASLFLGSII